MATKPIQRKGAEWDAQAYWARFVATAYFTEPMTIVGTVESLGDQMVRPGEYVPEVLIRLDDGSLVKVTAHQVRLVNELLRTKPVVGDRIRIRYLGEAPKAPPGLHPAKEFLVEVRRPPSSPNRPDAKNGEVSENDEGTGGYDEKEGP